MGAIGGDGVSIIEALPLDGSRDMTGPLTINQDSNALSIDIDSEATTADVVNIAATVLTTGNVIDIPDADALTTGKILNLVSNSADTGTRDLVTLTNENAAATGTTCLRIRQDAAQDGLFIDQNGNGIALLIDSEATTVNVVNIDSAQNTTADIINIGNANSLTTAKMVELNSNSADASARDLMRIFNVSSSAIGTTCLEVIQNAANQILILDHNATAAGSSYIDFQGTPAGNSTNPISTLTTSGAIQGHIQVEINGVKRWLAFLADPS